MYGLYTSLAFDHFRWRGKSYLKRLYVVSLIAFLAIYPSLRG